jgi:hypothetical protein
LPRWNETKAPKGEKNTSGVFKMVDHQSYKANNTQAKKIPGRIWPDWYPMLAAFRYSDSRELPGSW